MGNCERVCPTDAIKMENGVAVIDREHKCIACGKCVIECPRHVIALVPKVCKGYNKMLDARHGAKLLLEVCEVGCIGCAMCVKACRI